jgi:hypothetical protein
LHSFQVALLSKDIDPEVVAETSKPSNVWKAFFASQTERKDQVSALEERSDTSWEDLESPPLDKLSAVTSSYATPKKLKVGFLLEAFADSIPIGLGKAEVLTELPEMDSLETPKSKIASDKAFKIVLAEWNILRGNFETFNDEFSKLGEGEKRYRDALSETVLKIHDAIRDTDARTSPITAHVGHDQTDASSMGTDSVWNAIWSICDPLATIEADVEKAAEKTLKMEESKTAISGKMATLDTNFHGLRTFAQDNLSNISQKIRDFENKRSSGGGVTNSLEYKRLLDRIGIVDEIAKRQTKDIGNGDRGVARLNAEVENLKRKYGIIESRTDDEDHGLKSIGDDWKDIVRTIENSR